MQRRSHVVLRDVILLIRSRDARSKFGGTRTKTPSIPWKAAVSEAVSSIVACASSQPRSFHAFPLFASRTTARTCCCATNKFSARALPTCPVIPVIAYVALLYHGSCWPRWKKPPFAPLSGSVASWTLVFPPSLSSIGAFGPPISVFTQLGCAELTLILVSRNS